jgi:hypothetical protein
LGAETDASALARLNVTTARGRRGEFMYHQAISQCVRNLEAVGIWLEKAEHHAAIKSFDAGVLLGSRLAPDMTPLAYQVQSACDYVKAGAGWLSGRTPPRHEDTERTLDELRARIRKTLAFARAIPERDYAAAAERRIAWPAAPGQVIGGEGYLLQIVIPNLYFHLAMAYAILRHNGVDVGKMDFLGPLDFEPAPS